MNRRGVLTALIALTLGASLLVGCTGGPPPATGKPSIVLILTDDQRFDTLWGMPWVRSDLMDHGVTFTNGFVSDSLCCPSRASILTGEYAGATGVWANRGQFGGFEAFRDRPTIATWLQGAGYHTALFGKYLNRYEDTSYVPPGWDRWAAIDGGASPYNFYYKYNLNLDGRMVRYGNKARDYSTDVLAGLATQYIHQTKGPLFMYFAPYAPHTPTDPAPEDRNKLADLGPNRPPNYDEADVSDKPAWVRNLPPLSAKQKAYLDAEKIKEFKTLLSVDRAVESIVDALQSTGRLQNTMIVFMSDNGFAWGEHRWANKIVPYEESIRVPFVVRYDPLVKAARTDAHLAVNIDLAPTFAAVAGVGAPGAQGMNMLPLLASAGAAWRHDFLVESMNLLGVPSYCAVRSDRYMYISYEATREEELYDLRRDPYELRNSVGDPALASVLAGMRTRLKQLCNPPPPVTSGASDEGGG